MLITKESLNNFRKDVEAALKEVANKYGVNIDAGGASYSNDHFSLTLRVNNVNSSGIKAQTQRALDNLTWFKNIYGKSFIEGRHRFKVVDYEYGKKYPVICIRDDGKDFAFHSSIADTKEFLNN